MDSTNVSQIEQTPFTFRGDEQALRTVVDRAVYALPGSRITSRTYGGNPAPDSLSEAAWIERYTETVRGVEVRRLRAIWIGDGRFEGTASILSFSYRSAYFDRPDEDDTTLSALRRRNVNPRDPEWGHMKLHVKALKATGKNIEGRIEAPPLLHFAVDAILQAIEDAGREAPTVTPTGDAPSDDAGREVQAAAPTGDALSEVTQRAGNNTLGLSGKTLALAELLAQGEGRKNAAKILNLSPSTIDGDGYAREITRRVTGRTGEVLKPGQLSKKLRDLGYGSPHMGG